jgi:hypothetical protein
MRTFGMVILVCGLCGAGGARAAAPDEAGPLAARGTKAFRQADFARALADFEEAVTLVERGRGDAALLPVLRFNLGRCLEELGRPREAVAAFERYLETPDSETARARATERIQALETRHFARLRVECEPARGTLTLNGRPAGQCGDVQTRLDPGVVEVRAAHPDGPVARGAFTLTAGVETQARLVFGARIQINGPAGEALVVRVDDQPVAGPPFTADVEPGPHRVEVRRDRGDPWTRDLRLRAGSTVVLAPFATTPGVGAATTPEQGGTWSSPWPWVAFGGAALAAGLGGWFWSEAGTNVDATEEALDIHNASSDPTVRAAARVTAENARADAESQRLAAYSFVGGAVLLTGLGVWLIWPSATPEEGHGLHVGPGSFGWSTSW